MSAEKKTRKVSKKPVDIEAEAEKAKENRIASIERKLVLQESEDTSYAIDDMRQFRFQAEFGEDGNISIKEGVFSTGAMVPAMVFEQMETWRYLFHNVTLTGMIVDAVNDEILYSFSADDFVDKTIEEQT